jgi:hypothetical protein
MAFFDAQISVKKDELASTHSTPDSKFSFIFTGLYRPVGDHLLKRADVPSVRAELTINLLGGLADIRRVVCEFQTIN